MTERRASRSKQRSRGKNAESLSPKISILIADDHTLFRRGLRSLLESERDFVVVGEAQDGRQALTLVETLHPDVVLMDIAMSTLNGIEATRQIHHAFPDVCIIIVSAHGDEEYIVRTRELGASGYVHKESSMAALAAAIRMAMASGVWFQLLSAQGDDDGSGRGRRTRSNPPRPPATRQLTSREMEVLQLIAEGRANKQSAIELGISIKTVEKHRQRVMDKLDIHDVAGLTRYAIAQGIIAGRDRGEDLGSGTTRPPDT